MFQTPAADYLDMVKKKKLAALDITADEIERMVEERFQARKDKDWARADEIRDALQEKGIVLKDGKDRTTWDVV